MEIMAEFTDGLDKDLKHMRESMAEGARATNLYFEGMKTHLGDLRVEVQSSVEAMSTDITVRQQHRFMDVTNCH
jgi:hypothetical protein